ncbi:MBL fold metallo-hydrolase [Eubacterium sp.]|uniref:MBL fold metallo-hydrolase n=1 Tax=Eubacterium sp. TaxID=142586 RepID=UPI003992768D
MKVTYLKHSGFMVESRNYIYLFDYIGGNIDKAIKSDKKIYVMVSHIHDDHFSKIIFDIATKHDNVTYILSYDVVKKIKKNAILSKMTEQLNIIRVQAHEKYKIDDIVVETLKSTDEGVAFIVSEKDGTIYHAGDLNWWHWEGEPKSWNRNMEVNFKREIDSMRGRKIDIAFIPLDPRQEDAYYLGMNYFIKNVGANEIYPMHFWGEPRIIDRYKSEYGGENIVSKAFFCK